MATMILAMNCIAVTSCEISTVPGSVHASVCVCVCAYKPMIHCL